MAHPLLLTKAAAARELGISRRTIQRYCATAWSSGILQGGKVDLNALKAAIAFRLKCEKRGFPLGKKRLQRSLRLTPLERKRIGFARSMEQRLAIIRREFDAMTDGQQMQILLLGIMTEMFRPQALANAQQLLEKFSSAAKCNK